MNAIELKQMQIDSNESMKRFGCYDCGSTIVGHHTATCEMVWPGDKRDLPSKEGTQAWTHEIPEHLK